jgi:hypothetical protein
MLSPVEYLFAAHVALADQAARKQGWLPRGRVDWLKQDGTVVLFICIVAQLEGVPHGATVHVVGEAPAELRRMAKIAASPLSRALES